MLSKKQKRDLEKEEHQRKLKIYFEKNPKFARMMNEDYSDYGHKINTWGRVEKL